jgi:hypothetical protein
VPSPAFTEIKPKPSTVQCDFKIVAQINTIVVQEIVTNVKGKDRRERKASLKDRGILLP